MDIQNLERSDLEEIATILPMGWEGEIPTIDAYISDDYCFPIKASIGNKIVGTGTAIMHNGSAWLAHIIVHPNYRKQGIGTLITQTLVDASYSKGCATISLLATELGEPVYRKMGFETETEYLIFRCEGLTELFEISEHIVAANSNFTNQMLRLDRQVSGEDRVLLLQQHLLNGYVFLEGEEVNGFYLPTLGDGLIIATTGAAGQALTKLRLNSKDFAAFPIDNENAGAFMQQCHFTDFRKEKRMRLGKKRNWQLQHIYAIIGGNLG